MSVLRPLCRVPWLWQRTTPTNCFSRCASTLSNVIAPESGKTKLQGYLPHAFLVNNIQVDGAILCLPETWLMWDAKTFQDINPSNLAILDLIDPAPEVLVIGCGSQMKQINPGLKQHLTARGIAMEVLDTVGNWLR
eukprot:GHUV01016728.1.p2 GENE.GHUV01016728.1~~GHUV01016728.1.p2  ORF type:complete len:136 (+),score=1.95 GHUV01016728.1:62-469(+)